MFQLDEVLDYVNYFEEKGIEVVFFGIPIRSGAILFHSLLDNHPQVLHLPINLYYYMDWEYTLKDSLPERLTEDFFERSMFLYDKVGGLGAHYDEVLDLRFDVIRQIMPLVLSRLKTVDRKTFLLAFHFVFAQLFGIPLERIQVLFIHTHFMSNAFGYGSYQTMRTRRLSPELVQELLKTDPVEGISREDPILGACLTDFPKARFIVCIRDPFAGLYAFLKHLEEQTHHPLMHPNDLVSFVTRSHLAVLNYYSVFGMRRLLEDRLLIVSFEGMHRGCEETMRAVARFLEIEETPSLCASTFMGHGWSSRGLSRQGEARVGTHPSFLAKEKDWQTQWDEGTQQFFGHLANPLAEGFGYEPVEIRVGWERDWMPSVEERVYRAYPGYLKEQGEGVEERLKDWECYPVVREQMLESIRAAGQKVAKQCPLSTWGPQGAGPLGGGWGRAPL